MDNLTPHHLDPTDGNPSDVDWVSSPNVVRTDKTLVVKDLFLTNDNEVQMLRGQRIHRTASSANYTLAVNDYLLGITSLAVAPSIGLPAPSMAAIGKIYIVKDEVGGAGTTTITIRSEGEKTIDGATSLTITSNYGVSRIYTNGANWFTY